MDYSTILREQFRDHLDVFRRNEAELKRDRRRRREFEKQIEEQTQKLLTRINQEVLSPFYQNQVAALLYLELMSIGEVSSNAFRTAWQRNVLQSQRRDMWNEHLEQWNMMEMVRTCETPGLNPNNLPVGSWFLQFDFALAKPYISHDDETLYIIDNPGSKDHVFGLPLIRPSSWKGNLRSTMRRLKGWKDNEPAIARLFGNPKGAESDFRAGRLECYPTFFRRIGLEIINPHDRARKVGKNPILFECVPAGAKGTFSLLYVPFDLIGRENEGDINAQAKEDVQLIAEAIKAMMLTYGFSAKRTSGYGTAKDELENGKICTRAHPAGWPITCLSRLPEEVKNVPF